MPDAKLSHVAERHRAATGLVTLDGIGLAIGLLPLTLNGPTAGGGVGM